MSFLSAFFNRLRPERRPPSGPLTTKESSDRTLMVEKERLGETRPTTKHDTSS
jgi:hypothetical protein